MYLSREENIRMAIMRRSGFLLGMIGWGCGLLLAWSSATTAHERPVPILWNPWKTSYRIPWQPSYVETTPVFHPPLGMLRIASGHEYTQEAVDDPCERDPASQECYCQSYPDDSTCSGTEDQTTQEVSDMSDTSDVSETSEDIQAPQDSDSELSEQASPDNVPAPELNVPVPRWGTGQGPLQGDVPWYQRFQKR